MGNAQRPSPSRAIFLAIRVRRNRKGVGENPLNGKGMPLTDNAEGENIVCSRVKT